MKIFFIISIAIFLLISLPIRLKCKFIYDIISNNGYLSLFFFKIKFFLSKFRLYFLRIEIERNNKTETIYFSDFQSKSKFKEVFFSELIKYISIKNIRIYSNFGIEDNPFVSSILAKSSEIIFKIARIFVNNKKRIENSKIIFIPNFYRSKFLLCFTSSIKFSILLIIFCFFKSILIYIRKKGEKFKHAWQQKTSRRCARRNP